ncbi:MAG: NAD(P)H-dependent oxidoreductase, partial [Bradyrhizobium sp.]|nr:NAD(P)H-dependent oxidoreductase [Bradyrhizobium sp.]
MKLIAISGSLRSASHNAAVLLAAKRLAPAGVAIDLFDGIGKLPFFNSDLETPERLPEPVSAFRRIVGAADG